MLNVPFLLALQFIVLEVSIEGKGRDDCGWKKDKNTKNKVGEKYGLNYYHVDNEGATKARKYQNILQNVTTLVFYQYVSEI